MIFYSNGNALEVAGPSGALLAFALVGIITICVMECVSELIQMFPTPNAIVEFVRVFVDEDLAWVVGIAYWYTYASIFATQIIQAANFTDYWDWAQFYQTAFLYVVTPFVILGINLTGVYWFGVIETVGGILKVAMVIGGGIYMYRVHDEKGYGSKNINTGFANNELYASNTQTAGCFVFPIIAYGFLGAETMTVTAFEAKDLPSLRRPSQLIAYFVLAIYLFCVIGEYLNVNWRDQSLPTKYITQNSTVERRQQSGEVDLSDITVPLKSHAVIVIAALRAGQRNMAGFLNGCMIFSALSAANTSLYVASRVLYGMTEKIDRFSNLGFLNRLGTVWDRTGVPVRALCVSFIAFVWLPFLRLKGGIGVSDASPLVPR